MHRPKPKVYRVSPQDELPQGLKIYREWLFVVCNDIPASHLSDFIFFVTFWSAFQTYIPHPRNLFDLHVSSPELTPSAKLSSRSKKTPPSRRHRLLCYNTLGEKDPTLAKPSQISLLFTLTSWFLASKAKLGTNPG